MPFHFIVRFEPRPGHEARFREEMLRSIEASRREAGCVSIRGFESVRDPIVFAICSEWVDEAAFELHAGLPHTLSVLRAAEELLSHPVIGLRTRLIAGGLGAGAGRQA